MAEVQVVRAVAAGGARQGMERMIGISKATAGAEHIFMTLQRVPPGGRTTLHRHTNCETASYNLRGTVRIYSGEHKEQVQEAGPGDFAYIPANVWHMVENASETEWVEAIIARDAAEEIVEEHPAAPAAKLHPSSG